jgi:uncharacterized membrane protein YvbJ
MKCPQCDFENEEGSKFCKNCNEPLVKFKIPNTIENPYIKIEEEDQPFELISDDEDEEDNVYKCPKCNATIEEGLKLCGNCKAEIVWKDRKPKLSGAYVMQKAGCALTQLGCLIPLLIIFAFAAYVIIASLLKM